MTISARSGSFNIARDPVRRRQAAILLALGVSLLVVCIVALGVGALAIPPLEVVSIVGSALGLVPGEMDPLTSAVVLSIRMPRILLGLAVGGSLGLAGAALQALFRNPLADPALVGVSGGAACGAVAWIIFGVFAPSWLLGPWSMPVAAFLAGLMATLLVYSMAHSQHRSDIATLLLAGLAMNALTSAILGYLVYLGNEQQVRALTFWLLGSLGGATWATLIPALSCMIVAIAIFLPLARPFDVMALGEADATRLGVSVRQLKILTVGAVALGVGAGVALTGTIGFVGLLAPHLVRLIGGTSNRYVLPGAALMGALLITAADIVARLVVAPAELPIGIVTSALGAPFFLWLLRSRLRNAGNT